PGDRPRGQRKEPRRGVLTPRLGETPFPRIAAVTLQHVPTTENSIELTAATITSAEPAAPIAVEGTSDEPAGLAQDVAGQARRAWYASRPSFAEWLDQTGGEL